jgi:GT2 family glycosyltransferase
MTMASAPRTDPQLPDVTVSIVSYNTCEPLRNCLASLKALKDAGEVSMDVVVADNGSTDGSVEMTRTAFPWVRLVETGGNIGYGRANNAGLAGVASRYVFVLNSDTEVQPGALAVMRDFMDSNPKVGCVGAQLVLSDGSTQTSCARDPGLLAVFWEQTYLDKLLPNNRITGNYLMTNWDYKDRRHVEQVCGACLFARREAFEQIGGFDPAYFMYFEDTDFCIRLRLAGWPIYFVPEARILHLLGASSAKSWETRARMVSAYNKSRYYYFTRYHGRLKGLLIKAIVLMGALLRLAKWSAVALVRPASRDQVRLFREVVKQTWNMAPVGDNSG